METGRGEGEEAAEKCLQARELLKRHLRRDDFL